MAGHHRLLAACLALRALLLVACTAAAGQPPAGRPASNWAVILSSSRYWFNYRHASNALSVYQAVRRWGQPLLVRAARPAPDRAPVLLPRCPTRTLNRPATRNPKTCAALPCAVQAGHPRQPHPAHAGRPAGLQPAQPAPGRGVRQRGPGPGQPLSRGHPAGLSWPRGQRGQPAGRADRWGPGGAAGPPVNCPAGQQLFRWPAGQLASAQAQPSSALACLFYTISFPRLHALPARQVGTARARPWPSSCAATRGPTCSSTSPGMEGTAS